MIKLAQRNAMYRDPTMGAAAMVGATQDSMTAAASNPNGAMMGFMGMNMAQQTGGMNAQNLYAMGMQQQAQQQVQQPQAPQQAPKSAPAAAAEGWTCPACGTVNKGKFCSDCGAPKPVAPEGWTCPTCGTVNKGKFCSDCGTPKPAGTPKYKCDKCGWEPEDPANPPKFCPECGDPFDDKDIVK